MFKVGSLFSGIGGLDLGLERAGMRVVWQCEIDPACRRVLRRRFPDVTLYDDVTELRGGEIAAIDVLVGGFPCQDLSVAGRRAGLKGERSGLFHEFMRLASELAPRWLIIENVPGLLSSNSGRDMGTVLGTLAKLGYGFAYRVLDAQYFGVAQRRRRVFIVGCLGDAAGSAEVLFEPEGVRWNPPARPEARARVTGTLAASAGTGGLGGIGQSNSAITSRIVEVTSTLQGGGRRGYRIDAESAGGGQLLPVIAGTLTNDGKAAGSATGQMAYADQLVPLFNPHRTSTGPGEYVEGWKPDTVHDALTASPPPKDWPVAVETVGVRRLTPLERERLQGFPDNWTEGESDSARDRMTGNAVCVPVAEWIGKRLIDVHQRFFEEV